MAVALLTGATGFVGARLHPLLIARGTEVRCLTRDVRKARARFPDRRWVAGDVGDEGSVRQALKGCSAAYYLVHEMGATPDFGARESATATTFARAAGDAGLGRIIYLGGVLPSDAAPSEHLRSRADVGEILMRGPVPALELRASMIIGQGSLSFLIVRDLAARLPFMILPRWLDSRTEPVAIDDVLLALDRALDIPLVESRSFDLPGPEILSGREILMRTASALGLREPVCIRVPLLTPRLSSHWVRFVTRAEWKVAREIVVGLTTDLLARDRRYWELIGRQRLIGYDEAARQAVAEERKERPAGGAWGLMEGLMRRFRGRRAL
jgi:uncharacterized protein YbjT (DUF2867 family)